KGNDECRMMNDEHNVFCSSFIILHSSFPSFSPQHQIHHPAAADVRSRSAAMAQDVRVAATRFRKSVGQFWHPLEGTVIVDGLGLGFHFGGEPSVGDGAEGVAEDVSEKTTLDCRGTGARMERGRAFGYFIDMPHLRCCGICSSLICGT